MAAPSAVAMRKIWALVGTSSSMPGTRWSRSASRISWSMSRSSLMPASSRPERRRGSRAARKRFTGAMPLRRRRFELGLVQIITPRSAARSMSRVGEPDAVAERQARPEEAEAVEVLERGAARPAARVLALVGGLDEVHVHPDARAAPRLASSAVSASSEHQWRFAGASWMRIRSRAVLAVSAPRGSRNRSQLVGERDRLAGQEGGDVRGKIGRQPLHEGLVRLVGEAVLVAQHVGVGHPHADVPVGLEDPVGDLPDA